MECMELAVESRRGWNGRLGLREPLLQEAVSVCVMEKAWTDKAHRTRGKGSRQNGRR